jgi:hypothetical protein
MATFSEKPTPDNAQQSPFDLQVRRAAKQGQQIRIVQIRYVSTPDADLRISQALDLLFGNCEVDRNKSARETEDNRDDKQG